ncbi:MAG: type II secretion system GspH family protein [Elusimicrobiota bacterium]|jgi:hypothetical protein|nr:type II secretion system GspH family protein [Elusimicrobiota bacterium]
MKNNNKGFTIIEAVIAMLLVAIITGGVFAALMAARRAIIEPSYKEEMAFAAEGVLNELKTNVDASTADGHGSGVGDDPCGNSGPLTWGGHSVNCKLPEACPDGSGPSTIFYDVHEMPLKDTLDGGEVRLPRVYIEVICERGTL